MMMRTMFGACLVALACAPAGESTPQADSPRVDTPAVSQPVRPAPVAREVYIDSVKIGETVLVYGRARTFENTVQVRVRDDSGRVVADTFTTSDGEMGNHNPYVATIRLSGFTGARLRVEAFEYSANDGSVRSLVDTLIPYARPR
jgi:hypothetical protein